MRASTILLSILLTLFLLLAGFFTVYYDYGAHGVYRQQGWDMEQKAQVVATLNYLGYQDADLSFYDDSERSHLADVKHLLTIFRLLTVLLCLVVLALLVKAERTTIRRSFLYGGMGTIGIVIFLALLSINFTSFWTSFHAVLFPQGNWMFPAESALITLFPESFFRGFAIQVLLAGWSYGIVAVIMGRFLRTTPSG